jgi:hypothetical protein
VPALHPNLCHDWVHIADEIDLRNGSSASDRDGNARVLSAKFDVDKSISILSRRDVAGTRDHRNTAGRLY